VLRGSNSRHSPCKRESSPLTAPAFACHSL